MKFSSTLVAVAGVVSLSCISVASADGNRYNKDRFYHSEISAAEAYSEMRRNESVLIDVRSLPEYAAGHPGRAYNVPYPRISDDSQPQDPLTLYWEVYDIVKGKMDTPITTLCRTGSRSVAAGNILANPGDGLEPFTNVRNIWEGFVGQYKYAYAGGTILFGVNETTGEPEPYSLDLNNNGVMDDDTADVYEHTADANPDKDGWRNFQQLPWTTKIKKRRAYLQDRSQYEEFQQ